MEKSILLYGMTVEDFKEMLQQAIRGQFMGYNAGETQLDPDVLLTREETALFLKISLTTLWKWTNSGKLRSYGLGNRRYYKKSEVLASLTAF